MNVIGGIAFLLAILFQQGAAPVRVRLFSAVQPSEIRVTDGRSSTHQIRASGQMLMVDGRVTATPFRVNGAVTIQASAGESIHLNYPLEISAHSGRLLIIATPSREEYVAAVLAGESSVFRSAESLKAMAVAIRTYAVHFAGRHKDEGFDFCDTTHCQDFHAGAVTDRMRKAVEDTGNELMWNSGMPIAAYYHQDCGGITEARAPYLPQIHDAFCVSAGNSQWSAAVTKSDLQSMLQMAQIDSIEIIARSPSGRAARLEIRGPRSRTVEAEAFRLAVGRSFGWDRIRSDLYEVRRSGDRFVFEGRGAGHGIGLCQNGAAIMGEQGRSYRQILAYYYPNTVIGMNAQGLSWTRSSSERADLETTRLSRDQPLLAATERLMRAIENVTGRRYEVRPVIRVYPSVAAFRDSTGEPGWMAASTRDHLIRLQPVETLQSRGVLDSTLRHELTHVLIESRVRAGVPLWFREGMVLWLTEPASTGPLSRQVDVAALEQALQHPLSESQLRQSYRSARASIAGLVQMYNKATVIGWLEKGLPSDLPRLLRTSQ